MKTSTFAGRYSRSVVLTAAALVVAASGVGFSQDTGQDGDGDQQTRRLPNYYARVVTDDQREQIYEIQEKHASTIDELQKQLDEAIAARDKEVEAILTPDQLARVKEYEQEAQSRREARRGRRGNRGGNGAAGNAGGGQ